MTECAPERWFLGDAEEGSYLDRQSARATTIPLDQLLPARARGWKAQNDARWHLDSVAFMIKSFTSGNKVTVFVDGERYLASLLTDLRALTSSEFVLVTGWEFTNTISLDRTDPDKSRLSAVIADLAGRKVPLRALAFDNPIPTLGTAPFVDAVNAAYPPTGQPPLRSGFRDAAIGGQAFSHHQKEVFLGAADFGRCAAYVGGIDLAVDRWDTSRHQKTAKESTFYGWHDIQVKVQGNALHPLWANFAERWDSADRRLGNAPDFPYRLAPVPVPDWNDSRPGTQHVQALRTVASTASTDPGRFMPRGELTVLAGLAKAIRNAECYIYIEEQYLWDCELADLIRAQLVAKPRLRVVIVLAAESSLPPLFKEYNFHLRSEFLRRVTGAATTADIAFGHKTRVYVYGLYQTLPTAPKAVYVHTKLMIIDDRYVSIGSANVDRRSMRIETELTLGVVDADRVASTLDGNPATVCRFAKELRETLWAEHLHLLGPVPPDPVQALKNFPQGIVTDWHDGDTYTWPTNQKEAKVSTTHHARCYVNVPGSSRVPTAVKLTLDRGDRQWRSTPIGA